MVAYRQVKRATHWKQLVAFGQWPNYAATFWPHVPTAFNIEYYARAIRFLLHSFGSSDKSAKVDSFHGFGRKGEKIGQVRNRGDDWEIQFIRVGARIKLKGGESWYFEREPRGKPSFIELRTFNIEPAAFIFGRHAFGRKSI